SLIARLPEVIPDPIPEKEYLGVTHRDHKGEELFRTSTLQVKSLFELATATSFSVIIGYRDRLRDLMLEGVDVRDMQWGKKCVGYEEFDNEVWAIFQDGTRVRGDILIGCDGINSPSNCY